MKESFCRGWRSHVRGGPGLRGDDPRRNLVELLIISMSAGSSDPSDTESSTIPLRVDLVVQVQVQVQESEDRLERVRSSSKEAFCHHKDGLNQTAGF